MSAGDMFQGVVYLVDDDPSMLKMLSALTAVLNVSVRAHASAKEFLDGYRAMRSQCLVCDIRMPEIDGMALQQRLNAMHAVIPIIFLTGFAEVGVAVEAMRQGAFDFLEKPFSAQSFLNKVQAALGRSEVLYDRWRNAEATKARMALLSPRERTIVSHVVDGKSSREVAELLGISVRTVENHRTRIMEKLHVDSTLDIVKLFLREPDV